MKISLKKYDVFVISFSALWLGIILIDYLNKHSIYIKSIREFKFYNLFIFFKNPSLELIATDRVITEKSQDGTTKNIYGVFGDPVHFGIYAIFKLIK